MRDKELEQAVYEVQVAYLNMKRIFEKFVSDPSERWLSMLEEAARSYMLWSKRLDEKREEKYRKEMNA
jgi:hypothetical protein